LNDWKKQRAKFLLFPLNRNENKVKIFSSASFMSSGGNFILCLRITHQNPIKNAIKSHVEESDKTDEKTCEKYFEIAMKNQ
jgi:hypothetical protein